MLTRVCVYHCAQLSYTTQHRTVLIIFSVMLQTSTRAQMLLRQGGAKQTDPDTSKQNHQG